jgi:hypothetical protein
MEIVVLPAAESDVQAAFNRLWGVPIRHARQFGTHAVRIAKSKRIAGEYGTEIGDQKRAHRQKAFPGPA